MRTLGLLKPGTRVGALDAAFAAAEDRGLRVTWSRQVQLSLRDAERFYGAHRGKFFFQRLVLYMQDPVHAFVLEGPNAVSVWRELIGPTHRRANVELPDTLRGQFAQSDTRNAFHGSGSSEEAADEILFFEKLVKT